MRRLLMSLAAIAVAMPASAATIYREDFEDGVFDGAVAGETLPGGLPGASLFHVTQNFPASGASALGFVTGETAGGTPDGTYAFAATGTLYTPEIVLPGTGPITLTFDVANFGRGDVFFDRFDIGVYTQGSHFVRASSFPDYAQLGAQIYSQNSGYNSMVVALNDFAGQTIRLYAHYSVITATGQDFAGGRLDNIEITDASAVPEPATLSFVGFGVLGLAARRRRRN